MFRHTLIPFRRAALLTFAQITFSSAFASDSSAGSENWSNWLRMRDIVPQHYVCAHTSTPIKVDGNLDEPAWNAVPWTSDFQDIQGNSKPKPRFRTRAKLLWDDNYLYVAAELEEPHVWATLTEHDSVIFQDPDFEVFIDPDGDAHNYYEFEMNALNTGWDLLLKKPYKDGGPALNSWEIPGLKTAVHVRGTLNNPSDTDQGWTVEIAFPWSALKEYAGTASPPHDGDHWRIDFSRVEWQIDIKNGKYVKIPGHAEDNWVWSPQGIIDMHRPEQWGYLQFTTSDASSPPAFVPDPAFAAKRALQAVYYAERDFNARTGKWAATIDELRAHSDYQPSPVQVSLQRTATGFDATAPAPDFSGHTKTWHIREDAKVWSN